MGTSMQSQCNVVMVTQLVINIFLVKFSPQLGLYAPRVKSLLTNLGGNSIARSEHFTRRLLLSTRSKRWKGEMKKVGQWWEVHSTSKHAWLTCHPGLLVRYKVLGASSLPSMCSHCRKKTQYDSRQHLTRTKLCAADFIQQSAGETIRVVEVGRRSRMPSW